MGFIDDFFKHMHTANAPKESKAESTTAAEPGTVPIIGPKKDKLSMPVGHLSNTSNETSARARPLKDIHRHPIFPFLSQELQKKLKRDAHVMQDVPGMNEDRIKHIAHLLDDSGTMSILSKRSSKNKILGIAELLSKKAKDGKATVDEQKAAKYYTDLIRKHVKSPEISQENMRDIESGIEMYKSKSPEALKRQDHLKPTSELFRQLTDSSGPTGISHTVKTRQETSTGQRLHDLGEMGNTGMAFGRTSFQRKTNMPGRMGLPLDMLVGLHMLPEYAKHVGSTETHGDPDLIRENHHRYLGFKIMDHLLNGHDGDTFIKDITSDPRLKIESGDHDDDKSRETSYKKKLSLLKSQFNKDRTDRNTISAASRHSTSGRSVDSNEYIREANRQPRALPNAPEIPAEALSRTMTPQFDESTAQTKEGGGALNIPVTGSRGASKSKTPLNIPANEPVQKSLDSIRMSILKRKEEEKEKRFRQEISPALKEWMKSVDDKEENKRFFKSVIRERIVKKIKEGI